ncbi:Smg-4/UPF3 family protein [Actinidia rufa]|uniref:Smg-4/UPF3 family protein n=1 Tax=Actinidia rufa TaxID=165716 RepID=A0A7J0GFS9_9ERIC|nr:Smg-4/UPF3 family protein [Actinidia rufa]
MKGPLDRAKVVVRHLPPMISQSAFMEQVDGRFAGRYNWVSFRPGKTSQKRQSYARAYINFKGPGDIIEFAEFFDGHVFVNEKDPEYVEFLEFLAKPVENLPSAEIQLERREAERTGATKDAPIVTPLMDFVRQKRAAKGGTRRLLSNGKSIRKGAGSSSGSPSLGSGSSRRGSRRISTTMYVLRDTLKSTSGKDKSSYTLVPKPDNHQLSDKSVALAAATGTEVSEDESARSRPWRDCLPPPSHHLWPIGAPTRPVEGHRAKRKPFEVKSTLIGVESSLVRSVSKQISHNHSPRRRLTVGSAFPTRSGRVSDEIGASFRRASEEEAPIRGSQGDSPPLCKIPATKFPFKAMAAVWDTQEATLVWGELFSFQDCVWFYTWTGISGSIDTGKKKILLLKGKEKEIPHVSGGMSFRQSAASVRNSLGSSALKQNKQREASGRMIRSILLNKDAHQIQSSAVHSERQIQVSNPEKEKRPPRPQNVLLSLKDTNGALEDKVVANDLHGLSSEKPEKRTRNRDRPDRGVWTPLRRSDGSHASDESLSSSTSQSTHLQLDSAEGSRGEVKIDMLNARSGEVKTVGSGRSGYHSLDNGSHKHNGRRGLAHNVKDADGSSIVSEGKPLKRGGSSGYGSHEKQVWVQKSSAGS